MNDDPMMEAPSSTPPVKDSLGTRLVLLVTAPGRLMDLVRDNPQWWIPGLLIFLVISAFTFVISPISGPEQLELMRDSKLMEMMPEEAWQEQYESAMNMPMSQRVLQSLGGGFTTWIMVVIFGFILGFFARMSGGQGTFKQALGVVSWGAVIPFAFSSIVKAPLVVMTESVYTVNIGLAALLPDKDPGSVLYQVLMAYGDFFTWWGLIVLVIGFERVFKMSRGAAAVSVILPWAVLTLIPVGFALLFM